MAVALVLAGWGWGRWRLAQPLPEGERLRVALIQGTWGMRIATRPCGRTTPGLPAPDGGGGAAGAQLVIWPESAIPARCW